MNKKILISALALISSIAMMAQAQTSAPTDAAATPAAPAAPVSTLTFNVGVVTDYRYRGISQTRDKGAFQFGADYTDKNGFYVGTWNSTIKWIEDSTTPTVVSVKGPLETDLYGGYRGAIVGDLTFDVGVLQYYYAGNTLASTGAANANTTEVYGSLIYGPAYFKLSDSISNLFGTLNSKYSTYVDIGYNFDFGNGLTSLVHYGNQTYNGNNAPSQVTSYNDYSIALNKDFDGLVLSGTAIGTDFNKRGEKVPYTLSASGNKNLSGLTFVLGLKKNF
jgi:uncharacterized protein (TIGR02001 family)